VRRDDLPRLTRASVHPETHATLEELMMKTRVLVVDDDPDILESLEMALKDRHDIFVARNGADALEIVHTEDVDVVVLDLMMPVMNGYEVLRRMALSDTTVPVIVMSASDDISEGANDVRGVDYLKKPFDLDELEQKIAALSARN
jgi:DNA-binding response OmpR family regulator